MNRTRILMASLMTFWTVIIIACGAGGGGGGKSEGGKSGGGEGRDWGTFKSDGPLVMMGESAPKYPYQFVKSKTEQTGHNNVMDLYAFSGKFDTSELKAFCRDRKEHSSAKTFYYVVIFDDASNAQYPTTPFTAEFGDESQLLKHIRAIYVFNRVNGFSELRYHDLNIWDHVPSREKI